MCAYSSYALKCYVCDSTLKSDCADPFDKTKFTAADQMEVSANGVCVVRNTMKIFQNKIASLFAYL